MTLVRGGVYLTNSRWRSVQGNQFEASLFSYPVLLSAVEEFSKHVMVFNHSVPQTAHYSSVEWQHYMAPAGSEQTTFC